jgi:hypothetical protein
MSEKISVNLKAMQVMGSSAEYMAAQPQMGMCRSYTSPQPPQPAHTISHSIQEPSHYHNKAASSAVHISILRVME